MFVHYSTKEKFLALITVFLLFFTVGLSFFYISKENKRKTDILKAQVLKLQAEQKLKEKLDNISNINASSNLPIISSKSFLTSAISKRGIERVFGEREADLKLPIASISKLMTALIVVENIDLNSQIMATSDYVGGEESYFILEVGKKYKVRDLIANALIASDNDSARLLAGYFGEDDFINKMNQKASLLNLKNTKFFNVTGLDPVDNININYSTARDLTTLLMYIWNNYPQIIKMTNNISYNFCDINNFCKEIFNTNKLLSDKNLNLPVKIIASKTGTTDLALKNLIILFEYPEDILMINVVLGSKDNFTDTLSIINNLI